MIQTFVREVGRGSGVLQRSLEIAEVLRGGEGDDEDRKLVCTYFGKRFRKIVTVNESCLSSLLFIVTLVTMYIANDLICGVTYAINECEFSVSGGDLVLPSRIAFQLAFCVQDYFDVVQQPMDLSTIREKLSLGTYSNPWEFISDIQLMFDNAWLYNRKTSKVYKYCNKVMFYYSLVSDYFDVRSKTSFSLYINSFLSQSCLVFSSVISAFLVFQCSALCKSMYYLLTYRIASS